MTAEGDGEISVETCLTKGNKVPKPATNADNSDLSTLTGETRKSKAKAYTSEATKGVAVKYISTINNLNIQLKTNDNRFTVIENQLEAAMKALGTVPNTNAAPRIGDKSNDREVESIGSSQEYDEISDDDASLMGDQSGPNIISKEEDTSISIDDKFNKEDVQ